MCGLRWLKNHYDRYTHYRSLQALHPLQVVTVFC
jgi:hypothetical protein